MPRPRLIDQDAALYELGMWPYEGRTIKDLNEEERREIYRNRVKLSKMIPPVRLPGEEAKKYRTKDLDALSERNVAA